MEYIIVGIVAIVCLLIGLFIGKKLGHSDAQEARKRIENEAIELRQTNKNLELQLKDLNAKLETQQETAKQELKELSAEKNKVEIALTQRNTEFKNLQEKLDHQKADVEKLQEKFSADFENLANKILDRKSEKFTSLNKKNIEQILSPLKDKIKSFEDKVDKNNTDFIKTHSELGQKLKDLNELNSKISEEAQNLTNALKGETKTQGNWGEMILERVLEKSGLTKGREYDIQQSFENEDGKKQMPDVVINLPNEKQMIIDSKVSLVAYERYVNSSESLEKSKHLKDHIKSLKTHIKQLSEKKYEDLGFQKSPDFVLMFIPIEPALYLAQNEDQNFFYSAFDHNILLVSPTTLLSTLRTVDTIWKNEKQQQNANEIAKHAGNLYDKFTNLLVELETIGKRLKSTDVAYSDAMKKLTGKQNLIKDVEKLKQLGVRTSKDISQKWIKKANENSLLDHE
ncbi:DNA recombination protein RmuC [Psychroflexus salarius]|uniref:DNA recombination protein RmuC n=1 Tax=Psychroflexus salarius TaxID=1155689 RepID=A0A1M4XCW7_9FLAO|nr:DNA recombination protein RmuC [Psychroflexus salarius]SHE91271.1 DNA recombination protein RmuC [Psychroflexus salarius]